MDNPEKQLIFIQHKLFAFGYVDKFKVWYLITYWKIFQGIFVKLKPAKFYLPEGDPRTSEMKKNMIILNFIKS